MKRKDSWLELALMPQCCMSCGSRDVHTKEDLCLDCGERGLWADERTDKEYDER